MKIEECKKEITKLLWKVPKMDFAVINNVLKLLDTELRTWDFLRSLRENEKNLPKTNSDEIIKLALKVYEINKM